MVSTLTSTEAIESPSLDLEQSIDLELAAAFKSKVEISKLATEEAEARHAALKPRRSSCSSAFRTRLAIVSGELGFTTEAAPVVTQAAPVVTQAAPVVTQAAPMVTEAPAARGDLQAAAPEIVQAPAAVAAPLPSRWCSWPSRMRRWRRWPRWPGVATEVASLDGGGELRFHAVPSDGSDRRGPLFRVPRLSAVPRVPARSRRRCRCRASRRGRRRRAPRARRNANEIFLAGLANLQKDMKGAYASDPLAAFYADAPTPAATATATSMAASFKSTVAARGGGAARAAFAAARPKIGAKEAAKLAKASLAESDGDVVVPTAMEAPVAEAEKVA